VDGRQASYEAAFGKVLKRLREERGLSQEAVELEGGSHRTFVSDLERGIKTPSLTTIVKLAEVLKISPADLMNLVQAEAGEETSALAAQGAPSVAPTPIGAPLAAAIAEAVRTVGLSLLTREVQVSISPDDTLADVERTVEATELDLPAVLADAAVILASPGGERAQRTHRNSLGYIVRRDRPPAELRFTLEEAEAFLVDADRILAAVLSTNRVLENLHDLSVANGVPLFALLGMRNLSSFVGAVFASELARIEEARLAPNPNQDGYPDLLALTKKGVAYIAEKAHLNQLSVKEFWSPFPHGGLEVKATCGNTPEASVQAKPGIGETRLGILKSAEWKAHHQDTNNLLGLHWDFVDGIPTVLAVFYRNDLSRDDWGGIIVPREGGGRTTSVSIMKRGRMGEDLGVKKMGRGWLLLPDDNAMLNALAQQSVYALDLAQVRRYRPLAARRTT
jgi:transcriptional regulator with XRE-family HTH domain